MKTAAEGSRPPGGKGGTDYRSVLAVGCFTLLSRVSGVFREATKAHFLGTGMAADAFTVAFQVPNLFRRLVGEGAVSSALVPVLVHHERRAETQARRLLAERLLSFWWVLVGAITLAGVLGGGWLVSLGLQWGSFRDPEKLHLTEQLTGFLFVYLFFIGGAAAYQGILNARGIFGLPSLSPLVFNLAVIGGVWAAAPWLEPGRRVWVFAGAVLVGGLLQLGLVLPLVWRLGVRPQPRWPFGDPGVVQVLRLLGPATLGAGVYQVNVLVNTFLAGRLAAGSVAALSYSHRLLEVVLGVFVFALSSVSLTSLSRHAAGGDLAAYRGTLLEVLRLMVFVTVPSAVGLYALRRPVIALLFGSGAFGPGSLEMTAVAFQYHVLGLVFIALGRGFVSGFYALKDVRTPVKVAAWILGVNLLLAWSLSATRLEHGGIALASSLAVLIQSALLFLALRRKVPELSLEDLGPVLWRTALAAAVMGLLVALVVPFLHLGKGRLLLGVELLALIAAGAAVFFLLVLFLGLPEARWLLARLRSRLPRRRSSG